MAQVNFNYRVDMSAIATPSDPAGYIIAYDLDGVLKQKDYNGNVTLVGGSSTPLGKIMLRDANQTLFTDLAGAKAYIQQFTAAEITDESFDTDLNAYFFTVPKGADFSESSFFCSPDTSGEYLQIIDELGLIGVLGEGSFSANICDNVLSDVVFNQSGCFSGSTGSNKLKNITINGEYFFAYSTGNNEIENIVVIGDRFFQNATGNNLIVNADVTSLYSFFLSTGKNVFVNMDLKGDESFSPCSSTNEFYNCKFPNNCFSDVTGTNSFYNDTIFQGGCFYRSLANNFFYGNVTAGASFFFQAQGGNNYFYKDLTVGNSAFNNAKSNNFINKIVSAGNNLFRVAAPKNKNEIVELVTCGSNAFRDYVGSVYFSKLGENNLQNLPTDIFTVTTECCVNFNFLLDAYNDGDYVQMVANINLNPAQHLINLF